jgi:hypothetical protein
MNQRSDSPSPPADAPGPYERLGITADASFDQVQAAKQARLLEAAGDTMACSRVEAAYDAVLMERLKERQQGKVSTAAKTASQREQVPPAPKLAVMALPKLPQLPKFAQAALPKVSASAQGRELWFPVATTSALLALLVFVPAAPPELLLALATGMAVINLQRRSGKFLKAVVWSVGLLSLGLLLGGLLAAGLDPALPLGFPLSSVQVQSLPALVVLLLGALLLG